MYVIARIKVEINGIPLKSVVSVNTVNDNQHIGASCEIVVPLTARVEHYNASIQELNKQKGEQLSQLSGKDTNSFSSGDSITIRAKYNGYENANGADVDGYLPIFEGFLFDFYQQTPLKIKCLDYIYWFNLGIFGDKNIVFKTGTNTSTGIGKSYKSVELKTLIKEILSWVNKNIDNYNADNSANVKHIELLKEEIFDFTFVNISFVGMSPAACLEYIKREAGFNISLSGNKLFVGLASENLEVVKLDTTYNVIESNLQTTNLTRIKQKIGGTSNQGTHPSSIFQQIKLKAWFLNENGTKESIEIGDPNGQLREVRFYKVKKSSKLALLNGLTIPENYLNLANEALEKFRQNRYTGVVKTKLYPYCDVFWRAEYSDFSYPSRNGTYVVTEKKIELSESGFNQTLRLAYIYE